MRDTVKNITLAYALDLKAQKANYRFTNSSNAKNTIERDEMALSLLKTLPEDLMLIGDATKSNHSKMNFGTLFECTLTFHTSEKTLLKVAKSGADYDIEYKGIEYEVKTCLNGSYYNTPVRSYDFDVILLTLEGIFLIPKENISEYEGKNGKLPYKKHNLKHFEELEAFFPFFKK